LNGLQTERPVATSSILGRDICPWKPLDNILNPPSLLFSGYRCRRGVGEEDLSLGPSVLIVKLSPCTIIAFLMCIWTIFLKLSFDQYYDSYFQIKFFCGGDFQQNMSYDFQILWRSKFLFDRKVRVFAENGFTVIFLSWPMWNCPAICNKPSMPIVRRLSTCICFMAPRDTFGRVMKPLIAANLPQRGNKQTYLPVFLYCYVHSYKNEQNINRITEKEK